MQSPRMRFGSEAGKTLVSLGWQPQIPAMGHATQQWTGGSGMAGYGAAATGQVGSVPAGEEG